MLTIITSRNERHYPDVSYNSTSALSLCKAYISLTDLVNQAKALRDEEAIQYYEYSACKCLESFKHAS